MLFSHPDLPEGRFEPSFFESIFSLKFIFEILKRSRYQMHYTVGVPSYLITVQQR